ncbi:MAG: Type 1 glutamine amidotransferase-like domain-containing protein, partial [Culicoidibacterales bacterium]
DSSEEWDTFYGDDGQLRTIYEPPFNPYDASQTWINIFKMAEDEIVKSIKNSDCIVLIGGDAKALKERLSIFTAVYDTLLTYENSIIGVSAGAKIWFQHMFVEHEDTTGQIHLEVLEGMNYFPSKQAIAAHVDFSNEQLARLYALIQQSEIEEIIAIGNRGLLLYDTVNESLEMYGDVKIFQ